MLRNVLIVAVHVGAIAIAIAFTGYKYYTGVLLDRFRESKHLEEVHMAFKGFQDTFAREPKENPTMAQRFHRYYMLKIERTFRRNGIFHHLEYTRKSHEGVMVRTSDTNDDIWFNALLVIDRYEHDLQVHHDDTRPGYAWLKIKRDERRSPELDKVLTTWTYWNFIGYIFASELHINPDKITEFIASKLYNFFRYRPTFADYLYVDPEKTSDIFYSELQNLINDSDDMKRKVKLSRNGLAFQMDVYPDSGLLFWGPSMYSVDLVPAYQVDGRLYVATPLKGEVPNRLTWRHSFSRNEKLNPPGGAGQVLRALEAFRDREPDLEPLTSYYLKTALMYEMGEEYDWSDRALVLRFLGVLSRLEKCLDNGILPLYFDPEINWFSSMPAVSLRNMSDRIRLIRSSESELMKILKA